MRVSRPGYVSVLWGAGSATVRGPECARKRLSRAPTGNGGLRHPRQSNRISRIDGLCARIVLRKSRSIT